MNVEELIRLHDRVLNRKVEENVFLNQRLRARLQDRGRLRHSTWRLRIRHPLVVYGFLLILFTVLNFILVGHLEKRNIPSRPAQQLIQPMNAFSPYFPGSISDAYQQVMK
jgi:hypothetical protein